MATLSPTSSPSEDRSDYYVSGFTDNLMWHIDCGPVGHYCNGGGGGGGGIWRPIVILAIFITLFYVAVWIFGMGGVWSKMNQSESSRWCDIGTYISVTSLQLLFAWLYVVLSRSFLTATLQPLILSFMWIPYFRLTAILILALGDRTDIFEPEPPEGGCVPSCESCTDLFRPIFVAMQYLFYGIKLGGVLVAMFFGLLVTGFCLPPAVIPTEGFFGYKGDFIPETADRETFVRIMSIRTVIHVLLFSAPLLALLTVNTVNLPSNETTMAYVTFIMFVVLSCVEIVMMMFYLSNRGYSCDCQSRAKSTPSENTAGSQQQHYVPATISGPPMQREHTAAATSRNVRTKASVSTEYAPRDDVVEDKFFDLDEPEWMNPKSVSVHTAAKSASPLNRPKPSFGDVEMGRRTAKKLPDLNGPEWTTPTEASEQTADATFPASPVDIPVSQQTQAERDSECAICLQPPTRKTALGCGHVICHDCLIKIKADTNRCPFCKKEITLTIDLFN